MMQVPDRTRYEIKMVVPELMLIDLRHWIQVHSAGFHVSYPTRTVNNIYFDSPHLNSYEENQSGVAIRRKVRLRWYGESISNIRFTFELKCKRNMQGWKITQPLSSEIDLTAMTWTEIMYFVRRELSDDLRIYIENSSEPVLANKYKREYLVSLDGKVRATIDHEQTFFDQRFSSIPNFTYSTPHASDAILELKANTEDRDLLIQAVNQIPVRVGSYSKYVRGTEAFLNN